MIKKSKKKLKRKDEEEIFHNNDIGVGWVAGFFPEEQSGEVTRCEGAG